MGKVITRKSWGTLPARNYPLDDYIELRTIFQRVTKEVLDPLVDKRLSNLTVVLPAQVGYQFLIDWSHFRSLFVIATHNQGKYKEAIPLWERALAILREVPKARDEDTIPIIRSLQRAKEFKVHECGSYT